MPHTPTIVLIDCRFFLGPHRGISNFLDNLLRNLDSQHCKFILLVPYRANIPFPIDPSVFSVQRLPFFNHILWEQVTVTLATLIIKPDVYYSPHSTGPLILVRSVSYVATVHDVSFLLSQSQCPIPWKSPYKLLGRVYRRLIVTQVIHKYSRIATVSYSAARDITSIFPSVSHNLTTIYHGRPSAQVPPNSQLKQQQLLCVSGSDPQKNVSRLLRSLNDLQNSSGWTLLLVGIPSASAINTSLRNGLSIRSLPFTPQPALSHLYNSSYCCILPSLHESFGLPILEAITHNCHLALSNTGSFIEIAGPGHSYFDPHNVDSMTRALQTIIDLYPSPVPSSTLRYLTANIPSWTMVSRSYIELFRTL